MWGAPLPENVVRYPSAAAAEAGGFRPCLRCRPYRAVPVDIEDAPRLVCQAVSLILDGCLDDGGEQELAARLAVSARHLRRLFDLHLGVSPDGLARSARSHLARRLLDETDLAVTEVAFAAGFGSIRQFNREMRRVFRRPPHELRRLRRHHDRLVADGGLTVRLPHHQRLDWRELLRSPRLLVPGVEGIGDGRYRRTIWVRGRPGVLELASAGPADLGLTLHLPQWEELVHLVARSRRLAGLDSPAPDRSDLGSPQPRLQPWSWLEEAVAALLVGEDSRPVAEPLVSVITTLGTPVPGLADWGLTHAFPTAAALTAANLRGCGVPSATATAVAGLVTATRTRTLRLERHWDHDQIRFALEAVDALTARSRDLVAATLSGNHQRTPHRTW